MKVVEVVEESLERLYQMKGMEDRLVDMRGLVLLEVFRDMEGLVEDPQLMLVLPATLREVEVVQVDILVRVLQHNQRMPMEVLVVVEYLVRLLLMLVVVKVEVVVLVDILVPKMVRLQILVVVLEFLVGDRMEL